MQLSQPLFLNVKERVIVGLVLCCIFCVSLGYKYYQFHMLKTQGSPQVCAEVLLQYIKQKGTTSYFVLKLKSDFGVFYTTTYEDLQDIKHRQVLLRLVFAKVSFVEFLKGFYAPSFSLILLQGNSVKNTLRQWIIGQHPSQIMGEYYLTLFLSDGLPKEWRTLAQSYGIAHLFAISGFHIGILSALFFFLVGLLYKPLQARFFPFRNFFFDVGFVVLMLLVVYYVLLTQSPSYLRAVCMAGIMFFLLWCRVSLLRIETLFWCVLILLAFFPALMFSLGFYFSSFGVLYIFLFFKHFAIPNGFLKKCIYGILLNASVFFLMGVVVHYFFPYFSPLSLLALVLTPLFVVYYPFVLVVHLLGYGGILDDLLLWWVGLEVQTITFKPHFALFLLCNALSILAIFTRLAFFMLCVINVLYYAYGSYLYFYRF